MNRLSYASAKPEDNRLCPKCRSISDRDLDAVMRRTRTLHEVDLDLASWFHVGTFQQQPPADNQPVSVESITPGVGLGPSFPELCRRRGEPGRADKHRQQYDVIVERLSRVEGGQK